MSKQIDISQASVYVGTYRKYNEGSLFGKWLNLSDYSDIEEFYIACRELHSDEEDPEFMFQDYENIPEGLIDESWLSPNTFGVLQALEDMDDDQREAFLIWSENGSHNLSEEDIDQLISIFVDDYVGQYDCQEDFSRELIDEITDLTDFAKQYFDYKAFARDLFCCDYWYQDGHVFRNS